MSPEPTSAPPHRSLRRTGIVVGTLAVIVVVVGIVTRASGDARLRKWTDDQAIPTVVLIAPNVADSAAALDLPGRLEAYSRAPIYSRVSGYLKSWKVDIGTPVKAGQLLAEIETPDLDQQLLQARADLASAKANASLAESTAKRWQALLGSDSVSRQEADEKSGDYATKQAMVNASQANVDRVMAMKGFTRIVAPFDGVVTSRTTDVGALINAGGGAGQELFVVSDTKRLRAYVSVPQSYLSLVKRGTKARLVVPERAGKVYPATVESLSQAVTVSSGTMLMQLAVDNTAGDLVPGSFVSVSLDLPRNTTTLNIPPSALIVGKTGLQIATVGADNKVVLKPVTIARDMGKVIEVASGVEAHDRVVESPPDGIANGDVVRIAVPDPKARKKPDAKS